MTDTTPQENKVYCTLCDIHVHKKNYKNHCSSSRHLAREDESNSALLAQLQKPDNQCVATLESIAKKLNELERLLIVVLQALDEGDDDLDDVPEDEEKAQ